jgi:flotillin
MTYPLLTLGAWEWWAIIVGIPAMFMMMLLLIFVSRYKRCPSNRVLVVYGRVGHDKTAKCIHGGGVLVIPVTQDYEYLSLEPMTIEIDLTSALSLQNIRVNVPSTFTIGVSTKAEIMQNTAERLLGLSEREIAAKANDIIFGQLRLVIATLTIEQINQDRENFLELIRTNVGVELSKIGLEVINVNIRDITDESGYIDAIGKKAAAVAVNKARIEVAEANRTGAIGEATATRDREVNVADQSAKAVIGRKNAEREQRISVASLEAEGISGEAEASRNQEIAIASQHAITEQGRKQAQMEQRVKIATLEAEAVEGENQSKASIAEYNATLSEAQADSKRRGEVAMANSVRDVLIAEREREAAKLEKEQIVQQQIERKKIEIEAEAEAERLRRVAHGEADAILAKYKAEAEGVQAVLEAKASGYENMLKVCGSRPDLAPTLLMVEKMPELIREQVKAISNLKIDKVTVWDSGNGGGSENGGEGNGNGATANFLRGLIGSLPPMHELAKQAGVELPGVLGTVGGEGKTAPTATPTVSD